ncbi:MAG: valine--tRNA ligase [Patescibacteria group bacterium]
MTEEPYQEPDIPKALLSAYDSLATEKRVYQLELESGLFNPETSIEKGVTSKDAEPYTIIMPPPNANGRLHAGHALTITLQDILIRYERMKGKRALWVPGADHAGFETQIVYERKLELEGKSRFDIDPKELYKQIYDFTIENKAHMEEDVRRLGASCDWSREKFTLDPDVITTVQETFRKMHADSLIYRGKRIVNWCSKHQTSLSEVETEFKEKKDPFYYFQYGPFVIGTSRPETKFGDKYVVMHPEDTRYSKYTQGQQIPLEWINGPIVATVIKDSAIDMEFGTGVMTITPWHDQIDFDIAQRHKLEAEQIIDFNGHLLPIAGEFAGLYIKKARPLIVEKLMEKGLLVKVDKEYTHNIKCCYKCETQIEPQIKDQWFVKMQPLAAKALAAVEAGKIKFVPDNFEKIFTYWMNNTIDWNISRQIVWGIQIPAKICSICNVGLLDTDKATVCPSCGGELIADTDTFDTWFSSGQWPLLALGYPNMKDVDIYHPTSVMETGRDLIFKWIPRMVIFSLYLKNEVPFKYVYLNGLVNDAKGKKMSKSKGNVISPVDLSDKYGTDALRMGLIIGNTPGSDLALAEDKIKGYKHFSNKVWNIARFVLTAVEKTIFDADFSEWSEKDLILLTERNELVKKVTIELDQFHLYIAADDIYQYTWKNFADIILEDSKKVFKEGNDMEKASRAQFLLHTLRIIITALHPFMPHLTEELWSLVTRGIPADSSEAKDLLMAQKWPSPTV